MNVLPIVNILLLNYEYPPIGGGAGNATKELGRALVSLGHRVTVLTSQTPNFRGSIDDNGVTVHRIRSFRRHESHATLLEMIAYCVSALFAVSRIPKSESIDGVICFFALPVGPLGLFLKASRKIPLVLIYALSPPLVVCF